MATKMLSGTPQNLFDREGANNDSVFGPCIPRDLPAMKVLRL